MTATQAPSDSPSGSSGPLAEGISLRRVAALYERGRSGSALLAQASTLIEESRVELTVVTLAPQDTRAACCGVYVEAYNQGVRSDAAADLREAQRLMGPNAELARFQLLVEGKDPPIEEWVAASSIDLVLLPARRSWRGAQRHPLAGRLRRVTELRLASAGRDLDRATLVGAGPD